MLVHSIDFKVKGVTFENEEGKDIQKEIKKTLKEYKDNDYFNEFYGGYTNSEIKEMDLNVSEYEGEKFPAKLVGDEYNGEECLKIYMKTYDNKYIHVGYAPKEDLEELVDWLTKDDIKVDGKLEIVGGKYKHTEIYEENYEEKEKVVVEELTYGLKVILNFYNNEPSPQYKEMKEKEEKFKKQQNMKNNISIIAWIIVASVLVWILSKIWSFINWLVG